MASSKSLGSGTPRRRRFFKAGNHAACSGSPVSFRAARAEPSTPSLLQNWFSRGPSADSIQLDPTPPPALPPNSDGLQLPATGEHRDRLPRISFAKAALLRPSFGLADLVHRDSDPLASGGLADRYSSPVLRPVKPSVSRKGEPRAALLQMLSRTASVSGWNICTAAAPAQLTRIRPSCSNRPLDRLRRLPQPRVQVHRGAVRGPPPARPRPRFATAPNNRHADQPLGGDPPLSPAATESTGPS